MFLLLQIKGKLIARKHSASAFTPSRRSEEKGQNAVGGYHKRQIHSGFAFWEKCVINVLYILGYSRKKYQTMCASAPSSAYIQ